MKHKTAREWCAACGRELDVKGDPNSIDCDGECLRCAREDLELERELPDPAWGGPGVPRPGDPIG